MFLLVDSPINLFLRTFLTFHQNTQVPGHFGPLRHFSTGSEVFHLTVRYVGTKQSKDNSALGHLARIFQEDGDYFVHLTTQQSNPKLQSMFFIFTILSRLVLLTHVKGQLINTYLQGPEYITIEWFFCYDKSETIAQGLPKLWPHYAAKYNA